MLDAEQFVELCKLARDTAEAVEKAAAGHRVVRPVLKGKAKRKPEQELPAVRDYRFALQMANRLEVEADRAQSTWFVPAAVPLTDLLTAANRTTRALGSAFDGPEHDLHAAAETLRKAADAVEREALACVEPVPPVEPASLASIRAEALAMEAGILDPDHETAENAAFDAAFRGVHRLVAQARRLDTTRPVPVLPPWAQPGPTTEQLIAKSRGTLTLPPLGEIQTALREIIAWCDEGERSAVAPQQPETGGSGGRKAFSDPKACRMMAILNDWKMCRKLPKDKEPSQDKFLAHHGITLAEYLRFDSWFRKRMARGSELPDKKTVLTWEGQTQFVRLSEVLERTPATPSKAAAHAAK